MYVSRLFSPPSDKECSRAGSRLARSGSRRAASTLGQCPIGTCASFAWSLKMIGSSRSGRRLAGCRRNPPARRLSTIAAEIRRAWKDPYFGAEPYIRAMETMDRVGDSYGDDPGTTIVLRFLNNAGTWRGKDAQRIKNELRELVGIKLAKIKNPPANACLMCGGNPMHVGTLNDLEWWRCRNCGWEWSTTSEDAAHEDALSRDVDDDQETEWKAGSASTPWKKGMRVKFAPSEASLALYSTPPPRGAKGTTTSLPVGARSAVRIPGPAGGLVYVTWDRGGTCGVRPGDLILLKTRKAKASPRASKARTPKRRPNPRDRDGYASVSVDGNMGPAARKKVRELLRGRAPSVYTVRLGEGRDSRRMEDILAEHQLYRDSYGRVQIDKSDLMRLVPALLRSSDEDERQVGTDILATMRVEVV